MFSGEECGISYFLLICDVTSCVVSLVFRLTCAP